MLVKRYARRSNQGFRGLIHRGAVAGPGMVPLALDLAYGMPAGTMDDSDIAASRDDASDTPGAAEPKRKSNKASMLKYKPAHLRMAAAECTHVTSLQVDTDLWRDICAHYDLVSFTDVRVAYDVVEYAKCELRRLFFQSSTRRSELAQSWLDKIKVTVDGWRTQMILGGEELK